MRAPLPQMDWLQQLKQGLGAPASASASSNGASAAAAAANGNGASLPMAEAAADGDDEESAVMREVLAEMEKLMSAPGLLEQLQASAAGEQQQQQQQGADPEAWRQQLKKFEVGALALPGWPGGCLAAWLALAPSTGSAASLARARARPRLPSRRPCLPYRAQVDEAKLQALLGAEVDPELQALLASDSDDDDDDLELPPELQGDEEDDLRVLMQDPAELERILDQVGAPGWLGWAGCACLGGGVLGGCALAPSPDDLAPRCCRCPRPAPRATSGPRC